VSKQLGQYEVLRHRWQDEIGDWFDVVEPRAGRLLLARVLSGQRIQEARPALLTAARKLLDLSHPNVLRLLEIGESPEIFLVHEQADARLCEQLKVRPLPPIETRLATVASICAGLAEVHRHGLFDARFMCDAVFVSQERGARIDVTRSVLGPSRSAARFLPPEQIIRKDERPRPVADVFTAGILFYEILTGRRPFQGKNLHSILFEILEKDPTPVRSIDPAVSEPVATWLWKALAKDPAQRFSDGSALREALSVALGRPSASRG
jgi:eukaryotic-like serine/threonine-protein kinase